MFYRRKILFSLFEVFGNELPKITLQKLLFLFCSKQQEPLYHFVPLHYGCYSFSANADFMAMVRNGEMEEKEKTFCNRSSKNYYQDLTAADKNLFQNLKTTFHGWSENLLIKYTYVNHAYYAINSVIAESMITEEEYDQVLMQRPKPQAANLFTIGYEGKSIEEYFNELIKNKISILIDVRNNPQSMKYGFSKSKLQLFCKKLKLKYLHLPEVGIESSFRKGLKNQSDYDDLFHWYRKHTITNTISFQKSILDLLLAGHGVALTCFEKKSCQCHRMSLSEAIERLPGWKFNVIHI